MKSIIKIALVLAVFAGSVPTQAAYGQAPSDMPKAKITKRPQLHDGCHRRFAQMQGKPCH
jgi:hypothetical protein